MDCVILDGEPGPVDVFVLEVWERCRELASPVEIRSRDSPRRSAGLPDAQKPDSIKTHFSKAVQLGVRYVVQRRALAQSAR
jgi:hypothetical protein